MKEVTYTIQDAQGIHARPAGLLVKKLKEFTATPTLTKGEKTIDPRKMFALMGLGIKCGESVTFTFDGADEDAAAAALEAFLKENL
ncbi:MAG: HPr family phosphocarrier protein [Butyricicoccus sp.]|nr:HPr family phosphocarrier protein [Butyricicoccus sp.]